MAEIKLLGQTNFVLNNIGDKTYETCKNKMQAPWKKFYKTEQKIVSCN
jgi:hypothetical protein